MTVLYPESARERDAWIMERRGRREPVTPEVPYAFLLEQERFASGETGDVATLFLTNRECPWRCLMCDLWKHTVQQPVKPGQIPRQIEYALERLPPARQIKLYNSGSFFDRGAIPAEDHKVIAGLLRGFERVIVECHPALVGENCLSFAEQIGGQLEVAMGLETAHAGVLDKLNKRMTLEQYKAAAGWLRTSGIDLRSFVLVQPPFMAAREALYWGCRSIDFAQSCGATVVSLIPTRGGNGALEELAPMGAFALPSVSLLEDVLDYGVARCMGRVFVDLWEIDRFARCSACHVARKQRLQRMNLSQQVEHREVCGICGGAA